MSAPTQESQSEAAEELFNIYRQASTKKGGIPDAKSVILRMDNGKISLQEKGLKVWLCKHLPYFRTPYEFTKNMVALRALIDGALEELSKGDAQEDRVSAVEKMIALYNGLVTEKTKGGTGRLFKHDESILTRHPQITADRLFRKTPPESGLTLNAWIRTKFPKPQPKTLQEESENLHFAMSMLFPEEVRTALQQKLATVVLRTQNLQGFLDESQRAHFQTLLSGDESRFSTAQEALSLLDRITQELHEAEKASIQKLKEEVGTRIAEFESLLEGTGPAKKTVLQRWIQKLQAVNKASLSETNFSAVSAQLRECLSSHTKDLLEAATRDRIFTDRRKEISEALSLESPSVQALYPSFSEVVSGIFKTKPLDPAVLGTHYYGVFRLAAALDRASHMFQILYARLPLEKRSSSAFSSEQRNSKLLQAEAFSSQFFFDNTFSKKDLETAQTLLSSLETTIAGLQSEIEFDKKTTPEILRELNRFISIHDLIMNTQEELYSSRRFAKGTLPVPFTELKNTLEGIFLRMKISPTLNDHDFDQYLLTCKAELDGHIKNYVRETWNKGGRTETIDVDTFLAKSPQERWQYFMASVYP